MAVPLISAAGGQTRAGRSGPTNCRLALMTAPSQAGTNTLDPDVLEEIVRRIVDVAQPEEIILFGSAARGEMGPHSDVDLLIVKDGVRSLDVMKAIYRNLMGVGVAVDALVATSEHVERYRNSHALIFKPALSEGRTIYEAA